jgi:hypothetical protein
MMLYIGVQVVPNTDLDYLLRRHGYEKISNDFSKSGCIARYGRTVRTDAETASSNTPTMNGLYRLGPPEVLLIPAPDR